MDIEVKGLGRCGTLFLHVAPLARGRVILYFHDCTGFRVLELLPGWLPVALLAVQFSLVAPALEKDGDHDDASPDEKRGVGAFPQQEHHQTGDENT